MKAALVALALVACSRGGGERGAEARPGATSDAAAGDGPVVESRRCGEVTATLHGKLEEGRPWWGSLTFTVPGEAAPLVWKHGELEPWHWSVDVFAPDCGHVLLWWSYTGPYHVVATRRLGEYLRGAPPDHVLDGRLTESPGRVFDGAWTDARTVRYQWGCCDPSVAMTFTLPST